MVCWCVIRPGLHFSANAVRTDDYPTSLGWILTLATIEGALSVESHYDGRGSSTQEATKVIDFGMPSHITASTREGRSVPIRSSVAPEFFTFVFCFGGEILK